MDRAGDRGRRRAAPSAPRIARPELDPPCPLRPMPLVDAPGQSAGRAAHDRLVERDGAEVARPAARRAPHDRRLRELPGGTRDPLDQRDRLPGRDVAGARTGSRSSEAAGSCRCPGHLVDPPAGRPPDPEPRRVGRRRSSGRTRARAPRAPGDSGSRTRRGRDRREPIAARPRGQAPELKPPSGVFTFPLTTFPSRIAWTASSRRAASYQYSSAAVCGLVRPIASSTSSPERSRRAPSRAAPAPGRARRARDARARPEPCQGAASASTATAATAATAVASRDARRLRRDIALAPACASASAIATSSGSSRSRRRSRSVQTSVMVRLFRASESPARRAHARSACEIFLARPDLGRDRRTTAPRTASARPRGAAPPRARAARRTTCRRSLAVCALAPPSASASSSSRPARACDLVDERRRRPCTATRAARPRRAARGPGHHGRLEDLLRHVLGLLARARRRRTKR